MIKFGLFGLQVSEWNCKDNTYKRGLFSLQNNQTGLFLIMWNEIHIISKKWNINQQINTIVSPTHNQSPALLGHWDPISGDHLKPCTFVSSFLLILTCSTQILNFERLCFWTWWKNLLPGFWPLAYPQNSECTWPPAHNVPFLSWGKTIIATSKQLPYYFRDMLGTLHTSPQLIPIVDLIDKISIFVTLSWLRQPKNLR